MGENSKIEWCDHTFNPWIGCTKVSPGCSHCYAEAQDKRWHGALHWGKGAPRNRTSDKNWKEPLKWNRAAAEELNQFYGHQTLHGGVALCAEPRNPRVFCASLADWLDDEVPIEWLIDLLALIIQTPFLDWLLLSKRPQNWRPRLAKVTHETPASEVGIMAHFWLNGRAPHNVWIGTSIEDQKRADERIPKLAEIPAQRRFLSVEPLLEPVDLAFANFNGTDSFGSMPEIDWVIVGGESGPSARPMATGWARQILHDCRRAGVAFFMKQLGGSREKRGGIEDFPEDLRVREFPVSSASKAEI